MSVHCIALCSLPPHTHGVSQGPSSPHPCHAMPWLRPGIRRLSLVRIHCPGSSVHQSVLCHPLCFFFLCALARLGPNIRVLGRASAARCGHPPRGRRRAGIRPPISVSERDRATKAMICTLLCHATRSAQSWHLVSSAESSSQSPVSPVLDEYTSMQRGAVVWGRHHKGDGQGEDGPSCASVCAIEGESAI
ncbi:hypothetical protein GY45DRAFT_140222 [Cubamyces sp. BRFM 1775]|nr:hypothetical protein GY45DRAFT_140222 [Cubamyces sp. BRFM 1775]